MYTFSSEDSFTITCGRPGIGSIASIALYVADDDDDDWKVEWVRIYDGLEAFVIQCSALLGAHTAVHCYRW